MLTMQDPEDGGVYHKLTTPFEGFVKPVDCKQQRYVVQKSVTAALDFAAVMAQSSRLFASYEEDYPGILQTSSTGSGEGLCLGGKASGSYYNPESAQSEGINRQ